MMKEQGCFKYGRNAWMMMCFWVLWGIAAPLVGSVRLKQNINREWKFILGDVRGAQRTDYDDEEWDDVHLPHSFSMPYFMWHTYQIELSSNGVDWTVTVKDCFKGKTKEYKKNFGCDIAFLRIRFFSKNVALSELRLGGVPSALGNH